MSNRLTRAQVEQLGDVLSGTCDSIDTGLERIGLDPDDWDISTVQDQLLDVNVEECPACNWWFESCMLDDEGYCPDCMRVPEDEDDAS